MEMFREVSGVYLHCEPVDFRKAINGLSVLVEQEMSLSPFSGAVFVFCNRSRDKLKVLSALASCFALPPPSLGSYWDRNGFALWYKRLEKEKFKWPQRWPDDVVSLTETQLHWLLDGYDISQMQAHHSLQYSSVL